MSKLVAHGRYGFGEKRLRCTHTLIEPKQEAKIYGQRTPKKVDFLIDFDIEGEQ